MPHPAAAPAHIPDDRTPPMPDTARSGFDEHAYSSYRNEGDKLPPDGRVTGRGHPTSAAEESNSGHFDSHAVAVIIPAGVQLLPRPIQGFPGDRWQRVPDVAPSVLAVYCDGSRS